MKSRGISFIELLIAVMILCIIGVFTMGFVNSVDRIHSNLAVEIDDNVNLRIALEYLAREVRNSGSLKLVKRAGGVEREEEMISVVSVDYNPAEYLLLDGERVYIVNNIIRRNIDNYHIVSGIKSFQIINLGYGLYDLEVNSERGSLTTRIYRGK